MNQGCMVYAQMVEAREIPIAAVEPHPQDPEARRLDNARWLREWWYGPPLRRRRSDTDIDKAKARGARLLTNNLSPAQRAQYERYGYFEVTGGETGRRYRITDAYQMNVEELDSKGKHLKALCFMPRGGLVPGDVMLAQKLALELFETEALAVANIIPGRHHFPFSLFA
jgi:hypothetical protein